MIEARSGVRWATAAIALLTLACDKAEPKPATQVLVTVDSDLEVSRELTSVQVEIRSEDGTRDTPRHTFELTTSTPKDEQVQLPFSFGVTKTGQSAFQLRVTGLKGNATVVDLRWNVAFTDATTLGFSAFLGAICANKSCADGETCYPRRKAEIAAGDCATVPDATTSPITPGDELHDAGLIVEKAEAGSGGAGTSAAGSGGAGSAAGAGGAGRVAAGSGGAGGAEAGGRAAGSGGAGTAGCGACRPGETCVAGVCQCAGTAGDVFRDSDGDGHGDPAMKQSVCGSVPTGFVSVNDDCCDTDNRAFPGQDRGDVTASLCGDVGFDFDCDGVEQIGWPYLRSGTCCQTSDQAGWEGAIPDCGEIQIFTECDDTCQPVSRAAKQRCF
jgi:hypothetical protein